MIVHTLDPEALAGLSPGSHLVLIHEAPYEALRGRQLGLELRDTLLIVEPGRTRYAYLFRTDIDGTLAGMVVRYGTGALNIGGCRIGIGGGGTRCCFWPEHCRGHENSVLRPTLHGPPPPGWPDIIQGRWPTNLLFVHGPTCRPDGTRRVRASGGHYEKEQETRGLFPLKSNGTVDYADADGKEEIPAWACDPGCPVSALDLQSGELTTNPGTYRNTCSNDGYNGLSPRQAGTIVSLGDTGSASRFFPQFANDDEMLAWLKILIGDAP